MEEELSGVCFRVNIRNGVLQADERGGLLVEGNYSGLFCWSFFSCFGCVCVPFASQLLSYILGKKN